MANVIEFTMRMNDQFTKPMQKVSRTLFSLKGALVGLGVGALAKSFINAASTTEQLQVRLGVLLGSVKEGNRLFEEMADFASKVPFEFEEIMDSATMLAGIMKGGVDEIKDWMPLIGDLAATAGLGIRETTEQVQRMLSAGAASADKFRERGILSMLGFKSGVSVSIEATRKQLLEAWNSPVSKFRGATAKLATTWQGLLSMMADKWFSFRNLVMDAGMFNFLKAIAIVINEELEDGLDSAKKKAQAWSDAMVNGIQNVMGFIGVMADGIRGIHIIFKLVQVAVLGLATIVEGAGVAVATIFETIINGYVRLVNIMVSSLPDNIAEKLGLREIQEVDFTSRLTQDMVFFGEKTKEVAGELHNLLMEDLPSTGIEAALERIKSKYAELQDLQKDTAEETTKQLIEPVKTFYDFLTTEAENFQQKHKILVEDYAKGTFDIMMKSVDGISKAFGDAIATGKDLGKSLEQIARQVLSQIISMLIKVAVQRMIAAAVGKTAASVTGSATNAANVSAAASGAYAATAMIPIIGPALAPAVAASAIAGATSAAAAGKIAGAAVGGIAHGGLTNVPREATFLLDKGERVLSPSQNKDLTSFLGGDGGSGGVVIENIEIVILPNATNAQALLDMDPNEMREVVAGPVIDALNTLDKQGVRPNSEERKRS